MGRWQFRPRILHLSLPLPRSHDAPRRQRFSYRLRQRGWVLQAGKLSLKTYCPTYYRSLSRPRPLIVESSADRKFKRGKCVCVYGEKRRRRRRIKRSRNKRSNEAHLSRILPPLRDITFSLLYSSTSPTVPPTGTTMGIWNECNEGKLARTAA